MYPSPNPGNKELTDFVVRIAATVEVLMGFGCNKRQLGKEFRCEEVALGSGHCSPEQKNGDYLSHKSDEMNFVNELL